VAFIDRYRARWGVEPICRVLQFAPSTYYAAKRRPASARARRDEVLRVEIARVHTENFSVYGARKAWLQLLREGVDVGRDRVARLMADLGLRGVTRGRTTARTTFPALVEDRPLDLVRRDFNPSAPDLLWVADVTSVRIMGGFCYASFVTDAFSRKIVGWAVGEHPSAELTLDALETAVWTRWGEELDGLVHHSDRGSHYLAIRYTERLEAAGAVPSVGSKGDPFDNALAEAVNGLYKTELIRRRGWRTREDVELATAAWVQWYNERRLHGWCGDIPPDEYEAQYRRSVS